LLASLLVAVELALKSELSLLDIVSELLLTGIVKLSSHRFPTRASLAFFSQYARAAILFNQEFYVFNLL